MAQLFLWFTFLSVMELNRLTMISGFLNQCFHPSYFKVRQSPERAKRTVHPPLLHLRRELRAAAQPLPVLRKAQDQGPSLRRRQGKAQGLGPRDQDQDPKEPSLRVCTNILFLVDFITCVSSSSFMNFSITFQ